ncbi:MAG: DUF5131 family protein, partial [Pseudomonadota bacterium]
LCPHHIFQVLTKRADRMRAYCIGLGVPGREHQIKDAARKAGAPLRDMEVLSWRITALPLRNVWLGVSAEDQARADQRIPDLLATPAALRFVSAEPLLGMVELTRLPGCDALNGRRWGGLDGDVRRGWSSGGNARLDWVICGGESGRGARPMHPDWARSLRDQCQAAGVAFFMKQWGEWLPAEFGAAPDIHFQDGSWMDANTLPDIDGEDGWAFDEFKAHALFKRVGKRAAGRLLDGREWNEAPNG